jgi:light-regulated signal transduction histidine kinase (bacteriophytochrome)
MIEQHNPDLILLDVNLPDISGIEVCQRVKSTPAGSSVIVLQISATAITAPQATAALDKGADAYLIEPVDSNVLVATVKALLRLRRAEQELAAANERLRLLNKELGRSNEDLQQFAFAASHDLQEPLRTVSTFVSLLEETAADKLTTKERGYLKYIAEGSQRMRALIGDLLRYSQVGQKPAATQLVDLNTVLTWVLQDLRERIAESGANITHDALPSVIGDKEQLGELLQNLIGNAIKYARPGVQPVIQVSAAKENQGWVIRVHDNGLGLDSDYFQTIFAPFKRLHGKEIPGTGIGLAICRRVVEAHGGRIWVESVLALGSTFCFSLPADYGAVDDRVAT